MPLNKEAETVKATLVVRLRIRQLFFLQSGHPLQKNVVFHQWVKYICSNIICIRQDRVQKKKKKLLRNDLKKMVCSTSGSNISCSNIICIRQDRVQKKKKKNF